MKTITRLLVAAALSASAMLVNAEEAVAHRFFTAGWQSGGPALYNEDFSRVWQVEDNGELTDAWLLNDGRFVYSYSNRKGPKGKKVPTNAGMVLLDTEQNEIWRYKSQEGRSNHSCQPLPHGGFLLGETSFEGAWVVEVDKEGKEFKRIKLEGLGQIKDPIHTLRQVRKTREGTYLGTNMRKSIGFEWDAKGRVIKKYPNAKFVMVRLDSGNTLVSASFAKKGRGVVIEYDPAGNIVWELTKADIESFGITFSMGRGIQRLKNGNTVVTSVQHGNLIGKGELVKAFEVTPDKKMVWHIPAKASKKNMGSLQIIEEGVTDYFDIKR